jgi:hypothetical protein
MGVATPVGTSTHCPRVPWRQADQRFSAIFHVSTGAERRPLSVAVSECGDQRMDHARQRGGLGDRGLRVGPRRSRRAASSAAAASGTVAGRGADDLQLCGRQFGLEAVLAGQPGQDARRARREVQRLRVEEH